MDNCGGKHPGDASRGGSIAVAWKWNWKLNSKAMGLVFIGPILASSALPLLARPTFVLQEVAGTSFSPYRHLHLQSILCHESGSPTHLQVIWRICLGTPLQQNFLSWTLLNWPVGKFNPVIVPHKFQVEAQVKGECLRVNLQKIIDDNFANTDKNGQKQTKTSNMYIYQWGLLQTFRRL